MSGRTETIAAELEAIRARSPQDIAVLMVPLIESLDGNKPLADDGIDAALRRRDELAAMANSLAQVAAQSGDADTAVAIASIQADIEVIAPEEFVTPADGPTLAPPATAASDAADDEQAEGRPGLRARPGALLLSLIAAAALSYGAYVVAAARFRSGSLLGWLLNASTTLLAFAVMLRLSQFLAPRLKRRMLNMVMGSMALAACLGALLSYSHYTDDLWQPAAQTAGTRPATAPRPDRPNENTSGHADTSATGKTEGERPPISLWWLGETPATPPTDILDGDAVAQDAAAANDVGGRSDGGGHTTPHAPVAGTGSRRSPPSRQAAHHPTAVEHYQPLLDREVVLIDQKGTSHLGVLTGVSRDGVTLRTEVKMFGQPILAHRFYLHRNIRSLSLH